VAGCCSTQNEIQYLSTSDLELRRYELNYDDVKADLEERKPSSEKLQAVA
jgi:hypothetical protein